MTKSIPEWAERARGAWTHCGASRPPFAIEPGVNQESVWDYPRPPVLVTDSREIVVRVGSLELARSTQAVRVLETSHAPTFYIPRGDVRFEHLQRASAVSHCEWKGQATYYDVLAAERRIERAAWSYETPFSGAEALAGHIAFYAALVEAYVGGERARPQAGGYYGGWITSDVVGPFKGEPGTEGW